jgi:hypothetical protein
MPSAISAAARAARADPGLSPRASSWRRRIVDAALPSVLFPEIRALSRLVR